MVEYLTFEDLPNEVKQIADECLGTGVLRSKFVHQYIYQLVLKVSDGELVGFALYHLEDTKGVIDCVCVLPEHQGLGFGKALMFTVLRKLAKATSVELMLKVPKELATIGVGSSEALQKWGFKPIKTFDNYYANKSTMHKYLCAFCNEFPDTCTGILFSAA